MDVGILERKACLRQLLCKLLYVFTGLDIFARLLQILLERLSGGRFPHAVIRARTGHHIQQKRRRQGFERGPVLVEQGALLTSLYVELHDKHRCALRVLGLGHVEVADTQAAVRQGQAARAGNRAQYFVFSIQTRHTDFSIQGEFLRSGGELSVISFHHSSTVFSTPFELSCFRAS